MDRVKVSDLRQNLPEYLARARRGQRIKVTSRGRVVAELVPATADDAPEDVRRRLRGSVLRFADPLAPVLPESDWTLSR
jgi:prevent-host-death family protein